MKPVSQNGIGGLFTSYGPVGGYLLRLALLRRYGADGADDGEVLE